MQSQWAGVSAPAVRRSRIAGKGNQWVIVLAGGEGERMRSVIAPWLGRHCPKQYCSFTGKRTMLEHTLKRAHRLAPPERIITVIGRGHSSFLSRLPHPEAAGKVIEQPHNRGTAAGLLLPLTYITAVDPDSTVLIFPSDHFIYPEARFVKHAARASLLAESLQDRLILLGVEPDGPDSEYGWIEPGDAKKSWAWSSREAPREVLSFREKPARPQAEEFFCLGFLWNTLILAFKTRNLWRFARHLLPDTTERFQTLCKILEMGRRNGNGHGEDRKVMSEIYEDMRSSDFSRDFLERIPEHSLVLPMRDVQWSDWGRPDRIIESLARIGREPTFLATHSA